MAITYAPSVNFGAKDSLPSNDPSKVIKGSEFSVEFTAIQTAFSLAAPTASPTFTGTVTIASVDINGGNIDGTVIGGASAAAGTFTNLTATGTTTLAGVSTTADITFGDNDKAIFGAGSDLQIYHSGSDSFITDTGAGDLKISGESQIKLGSVGGEFYATFNNNSSVNLYYDNAEKLSTTATGIDVTGTVTADGLTVSGASYNAVYTSEAPTLDNDTHAGEALYLRSGGTAGLNNVQAVLSFGKADGGSARTGSAIASIQTDADADKIGLVMYRSVSSSSAQTLVKGLELSHGGNISFFEDTGTTPKFFWDASAEALGIGTTSPAAKLEILDGNSIGLRFGDVAAAPGSQTAGYIGMSTSAFSGNNGDLVLYPRTSAASNILLMGGNVGIGTTSPAYKLDVSTSSGEAYIRVDSATDQDGGFRISENGTNKWLIYNDASANALAFYDNSNVQERMRIDSSGALLVGTTTSAGAGGVGLTGQFRAGYQGVLNGFGGENSSGLFYSGGTSNGYVAINSNGSNTPLYVSLSASATATQLITFADSTTTVGSISTNGTTTAYNTSSDARLKENIADAEDASELIDAIQVRSFDWKADGSHQRYGMVAQELMTVAPEAVSGDPESDDMMGVDYSKLVPMLVKEIQSLRARVAQLEGA